MKTKSVCKQNKRKELKKAKRNDKKTKLIYSTLLLEEGSNCILYMNISNKIITKSIVNLLQVQKLLLYSYNDNNN